MLKIQKIGLGKFIDVQAGLSSSLLSQTISQDQLSIYGIPASLYHTLKEDNHYSVFVNPSQDIIENKKLQDDLEKAIQTEQVLAIGPISIQSIQILSSETHSNEDRYAHFLLAQKYHLPVLLEYNADYLVLLSVMKKFDLPYILLGFEGNQEIAYQFMKFNCFFSFGPDQLNLPKPYQEKLLKNLPVGSYFLQTGSLAMNPGSTMSIIEVYQQMANIRKSKIEIIKNEVLTSLSLLV